MVLLIHVDTSTTYPSGLIGVGGTTGRYWR
jgi:hypothetical protein